MTYENIVFEKEEAIGILLINRPKSLNALNPVTLNEIGCGTARCRAALPCHYRRR